MAINNLKLRVYGIQYIVMFITILYGISFDLFKVILGNLPNSPVKLPGALKLQLRITGVTQADAGNYTCTARNRHGVTTKTMKLIVTQ